MNYHFLSESFETSVPWSNVLSLCSNVKARIRQTCSKHNLPYEPWISCRVTQTYDTGACIYFYMGFVYRGMKEHPIHTFNKIESEARDEILRVGVLFFLFLSCTHTHTHTLTHSHSLSLSLAHSLSRALTLFLLILFSVEWWFFVAPPRYRQTACQVDASVGVRHGHEDLARGEECR
jgi:FAD linked oxidases, C-terminal domain